MKEAHKLLYELKSKMEKMGKDHKFIEKKLELKIDNDEFYKALTVKCDREEVNNMIVGTADKDRIAIAVKEETSHINKTINELS